MDTPVDITELKRAALSGRVEARVHAQVESIAKKETRDSKPYYEVVVADAEGKLTLRAWSDSPNFHPCAELAAGAFLEISGEFALSPNFGVEAKRWACRGLEDAERDALLAGTPELRRKQEADYAFIAEAAASIGDPRLRMLCAAFLADFGERFKRTAAARNYHHSRRGGLVEHTAQMMRAAEAISAVYPALNRDLLLAGALLHDSGKLWENAMPANGFAMPYSESGELLGHIAMGIELANSLWKKAQSADAASGWASLAPASEDVRLHLLHLIASHHGSKEFGSPVDPKTPEAWVLNLIDNLDAKLEMIFAGYETSPLLAPRIHERVRPLPGNLVAPLGKFTAPVNEAPPGGETGAEPAEP